MASLTGFISIGIQICGITAISEILGLDIPDRAAGRPMIFFGVGVNNDRIPIIRDGGDL